MIEEGLYSHLSGNNTVAALVATRIYPNVIPQHAGGEQTKLPCLVYQRIAVRRQPKYCGTDDLVRSEVQIDCYAATAHESLTLATAARGALIDFRGMMGADTVKATFLDDQMALASPDPGLYRQMLRFTLWHDETP